MNKTLRKLIATALALVLSVTMIVTMSYAWMTLSSSPIAEGMQITIGGGNTILIAADQTKVLDGKTYHFPGAFSPTLNFHQLQAYSYLSEVGNLSPVSTADGVHWFIPDYYDATDTAVLNGNAVVGQLKPTSQFALDTQLAYGNLSKDDARGGYVYLDFWAVSPGTDYYLRISQGDANGGSYVLELMEPKSVDADGDGTDDSYALVTTSGKAASTVRVGFLANEDFVTDDTMLYYQNTPAYRSQYTKLKGVYHNAGDPMWYSASYQFTIYEPNGDLHPGGDSGVYRATYPLGYQNNGLATPTDISDRLTVQLTNRFKSTSDTGVPLDELFQTAILGKTFHSLEEVKTAFYHTYLQEQLMPYVEKGKFLESTAALYSYCRNDSLVDANELASLSTAGATTDVTIVKLEKNVPQRIRMFVWLEGQDPDSVNGMEALDLALSIELAGSQIDKNGNTNANYETESSEEDRQYSSVTTTAPVSMSVPVHNRAGAWEGLCNLWQVQLLPSSDRKYGTVYSHWGADRI